jgi:hypothetical protein
MLQRKSKRGKKWTEEGGDCLGQANERNGQGMRVKEGKKIKVREGYREIKEEKWGSVEG